jgi:GMP synthase-like glutamine amidotransferase
MMAYGKTVILLQFEPEMHTFNSMARKRHDTIVTNA